MKIVKTIGDKKNNIRNLINFIWEAIDGAIKEIVFNTQSCSAAIYLSDSTKNTENLNAPRANLDSDRLSQVNELMSDAHASENDILNLEEKKG
ncbi:14651_t:CDS:2 [Cetraspora pellucida]|uniref:14651_t:CDS:1 n=1 Tax=Cetraspora pellucida TaxID=1433469 RepID=A0A9N8WCT8_9GLOM|nr:14651_t:CDS:2 [Cetraspora pellucida]